MKISKELIKNVLVEETENLSEDFSFYIDEDYIVFRDEGETLFDYNIYKFVFKCKEWANTQDYWTQSGYEINHLGNYFCMIKDMPDNQFFYANTEVEAIIKACEWILSELNK